MKRRFKAKRIKKEVKRNKKEKVKRLYNTDCVERRKNTGDSKRNKHVIYKRGENVKM